MKIAYLTTQWAKIHIVHCCVDDSFLRGTHAPSPDELQLVCVGRICEQKGHLILLEAASQLVVSGMEFRLVLWRMARFATKWKG